MSDINKKSENAEKVKGVADERRREFLRKSVYAAYATPVIMAILVEKASAKTSPQVYCPRHGWVNPSHPIHPL